ELNSETGKLYLRGTHGRVEWHSKLSEAAKKRSAMLDRNSKTGRYGVEKCYQPVTEVVIQPLTLTPILTPIQNSEECLSQAPDPSLKEIKAVKETRKPSTDQALMVEYWAELFAHKYGNQ